MESIVEIWTDLMKDQETFLKELGSRIVRQRKEQGVTQAQLGKLVGVTQQVIAEYEAGYRNIPVWRLLNLADALGVTAEELLNGGQGTRRKPGPAPKVQRLVERVHRLPKARQRFVMEMLEDALARAR